MEYLNLYELAGAIDVHNIINDIEARYIAEAGEVNNHADFAIYSVYNKLPDASREEKDIKDDLLRFRYLYAISESYNHNLSDINDAITRNNKRWDGAIKAVAYAAWSRIWGSLYDMPNWNAVCETVYKLKKQAGGNGYMSNNDDKPLKEGFSIFFANLELQPDHRGSTCTFQILVGSGSSNLNDIRTKYSSRFDDIEICESFVKSCEKLNVQLSQVDPNMRKLEYPSKSIMTAILHIEKSSTHLVPRALMRLREFKRSSVAAVAPIWLAELVDKTLDELKEYRKLYSDISDQLNGWFRARMGKNGMEIGAHTPREIAKFEKKVSVDGELPKSLSETIEETRINIYKQLDAQAITAVDMSSLERFVPPIAEDFNEENYSEFKDDLDKFTSKFTDFLDKSAESARNFNEEAETLKEEIGDGETNEGSRVQLDQIIDDYHDSAREEVNHAIYCALRLAYNRLLVPGDNLTKIITRLQEWAEVEPEGNGDEIYLLTLLDSFPEEFNNQIGDFIDDEHLITEEQDESGGGEEEVEEQDGSGTEESTATQQRIREFTKMCDTKYKGERDENTIRQYATIFFDAIEKLIGKWRGKFNARAWFELKVLLGGLSMLPLDDNGMDCANVSLNMDNDAYKEAQKKPLLLEKWETLRAPFESASPQQMFFIVAFTLLAKRFFTTNNGAHGMALNMTGKSTSDKRVHLDGRAVKGAIVKMMEKLFKWAGIAIPENLDKVNQNEKADGWFSRHMNDVVWVVLSNISKDTEMEALRELIAICDRKGNINNIDSPE